MPDFIPEARSRPQVDEAGFDHRLMTPAKLLELAGKWPLQAAVMHGLALTLDCADCGKAIGHLTDERGLPWRVEAGQLLADVLRHRVMRHDLSLSGGGDGGN